MSFQRRRGLGGPATTVDRQRLRRGLISLAAAGAALATGYLIAANFVFSSPDRTAASLVRVPRLLGEPAEDARDAVERLGLGLRLGGELFHPEAPVGDVVAQLPLPGQLVEPGAEVEATLSLGPETVTVPDVTGLTDVQATFVLGRLGLGTITTTTASHYRKGQVVRMVPEPGERLSIPAEVELVVSEGREVVAVPDLEGRLLDDVEVLLSSIGLVLGTVTFEPGAVGAPGRVIGQSPPPGFGLREGGEVSVRVAGRPSAGARGDGNDGNAGGDG